MKKGFTFFEMLLVICIISFILIIFSPANSSKITQKIQTQIFFDELLSEINLVKDKAMLQKQKICIEFDADNQRIYYLKDSSVKTWEVIELPEDLKLESNRNFCYLPDGHINSFSTIYFNSLTFDKEIRLIFQLGSGKFRISVE